MTDIAKKAKNAEQDAEAKMNTEKEHAKGKTKDASSFNPLLLACSHDVFFL
jgi:hypothetical protein